jgi:hypothetical protein
MQEIIRKNLRKIALPALLASGAFMAFECGVVPSAEHEWARENMGISMDSYDYAPKIANVAVMPELAGLELNNSGLRQAVEALTVEHVPGNPAETAKAAMWQLYQLAEANKGDERAATLMQALMFQAMGKYMEAAHWGKYNNTGDLGGFENFIKYDDIDIAELPPTYVEETKHGEAVHDGWWMIEYNGDNAATYNAPWDIFSAKTFNMAATAAALDQANALLSGGDINAWRDQQGTPQMIADIADNRYAKRTGKMIPKTINPYTRLDDYKKKGQAPKSASDLAKFAETDFFFLKPSTTELEGMQNFWNVRFGVSDDNKCIDGYMAYSTFAEEEFGVFPCFEINTPGVFMPHIGVIDFAPEVKAYQAKAINGLAETLRTADMGQDRRGQSFTINGTGKKTSALPVLGRSHG